MFRAGSPYCYAGFDSAEARADYAFRNEQLCYEYLRSLPKIPDPPRACRRGRHDMKRKSVTDGGFSTTWRGYCVNCHAAYHYSGASLTDAEAIAEFAATTPQPRTP